MEEYWSFTKPVKAENIKTHLYFSETPNDWTSLLYSPNL